MGQEKLGPGEDSSLDIAPWQAQARSLIAALGIPMQAQGGCWKLGSSGQEFQFPHMEKESKDAKGGHLASQRVPAYGTDFSLTGT